MPLFTRNELRKLFDVQGSCLSLFMPTHRVTSEIRQDRIRFKNLLQQAEESLAKEGYRPHEIKLLLEPEFRLLNETPFWENQSEGLALFRASDFFEAYLLPTAFEEQVHIGKRFHLKPLLPLLGGDGQFYVLAISQKAIRLFQATRYEISEVDLAKEVPKTLAEAMKFDDPQKQLQFHTGASAPQAASPTAGSKRPALFHGHGVGKDDTKDKILEYFRQVDKGLREILRNEQSPLLLAGLEYVPFMYREANSYPYLVEQAIVGNPDDMAPEEIREKAWFILKSYFGEAREEAAAKYGQLKGTGRTSSDLKEIVIAAYHGRIESLFVSNGEEQWGVFDPQSNSAEFHPEHEPGDEDLLDTAAIHTLLKDGAVFPVGRKNMPDDSLAAAVFRY